MICDSIGIHSTNAQGNRPILFEIAIGRIAASATVPIFNLTRAQVTCDLSFDNFKYSAVQALHDAAYERSHALGARLENKDTF